MFSFTAVRQFMLALTVTAITFVVGARDAKAQAQLTDGPYTTSTTISVMNPSNPSTLGTLTFAKFNPSLGLLIGIKFEITTTYTSQVFAVGFNPSGTANGLGCCTLDLDITDGSSYLSTGTLTDEMIGGVFSYSGLGYMATASSSNGATYSTLTKTFYRQNNFNLMGEFTGSSGTATLSVDGSIFSGGLYSSGGSSSVGPGDQTIGITGQVTYIYAVKP